MKVCRLTTLALTLLGPALPTMAEPGVQPASQNGAQAAAITDPVLLNTPSNSLGQTPFTEALYQGRLDEARAMIAHGADLHKRDRWGYTPLQEAIHNKHIPAATREAAVRLLLEAGADPNRDAHPNASTPLMMAASAGLPGVVKLLLEAGADVNSTLDSSGESALTCAAAAGHEDIMDMLIAAGANTDIHGAFYTPIGGFKDVTLLYYTTWGGLTERSRKLLAAAPAEEIRKPVYLYAAACTGNTELVRSYLEAAQSEHNRVQTSEHPSQVFPYAVYAGNVECVRLLLNAGVTPEAMRMAMVAAVRRGDTATAKVLLEAGADINAKRPGDMYKGYPPFYSDTTHGEWYPVIRNAGTSVTSNELPLAEAIYYGHKDMVTFLLDAGADIEGDVGEGVTPLMLAAWKGSLVAPGEIVELLLERGAKVDARSKNGMTPLMYAGYGGSREIVDILLAHGADPEARDEAGRSWRHFAALTHDHIESRRADGQRANRKLLLSLPDAEMNDTDAEGRNLLCYLIFSMNQRRYDSAIPVITRMVEKGADLNMRDKQGHTPLHYLMLTKHFNRQEHVDALIKLGAVH